MKLPNSFPPSFFGLFHFGEAVLQNVKFVNIHLFIYVCMCVDDIIVIILIYIYM